MLAVQLFLPAAEHVSAEQLIQAAAAADQYVPPKHLMQTDAPAAEYMPSGQLSGCSFGRLYSWCRPKV